MSYNGSGTFQINTSGQPVVTGTSISSTVFNALTADLATGLSTAITKDGQTTTTPRIPFALGINSSLVTDATNTTSGSIITAGGVGIAKAVFIGTTLNVAGASTMTGSIAVDSVTDSSSTTTGSIQTDGGVGIAKALYVGTTANVAGVATLTSNPVLSAGTANGVAYLNGSKVLTTGTALVFDGTNLGLGAPSAWGGSYKALQANRASLSSVGGTVFLGANFYNNGTANTYIATDFASLYGMADGQHRFYTAPSGTAGNAISFTQAMTLDASGRLLVGATSSFAGANLQIKPSSGNAAIATQVLTNGDNAINWYNASGTYVASISVNSGTVVYGTTSDYRLKENIIPMTNALDKVAALKPCTYTWKDSGDTGQGFIAHELQEVIPEAVSGQKDAVHEDGTPKLQGVDTSFVVATLTAAIQEQQALITTLTDRITALENK